MCGHCWVSRDGVANGGPGTPASQLGKGGFRDSWIAANVVACVRGRWYCLGFASILSPTSRERGKADPRAATPYAGISENVYWRTERTSRGCDRLVGRQVD